MVASLIRCLVVAVSLTGLSLGGTAFAKGEQCSKAKAKAECGKKADCSWNCKACSVKAAAKKAATPATASKKPAVGKAAAKPAADKPAAAAKTAKPAAAKTPAKPAAEPAEVPADEPTEEEMGDDAAAEDTEG